MSESTKTTCYGWGILIGMGLLILTLLSGCHRCELVVDAYGDKTASCLATSDEMLANTRAYLNQHQPNDDRVRPPGNQPNDQRVIPKGKRWEI